MKLYSCSKCGYHLGADIIEGEITSCFQCGVRLTGFHKETSSEIFIRNHVFLITYLFFILIIVLGYGDHAFIAVGFLICTLIAIGKFLIYAVKKVKIMP